MLTLFGAYTIGALLGMRHAFEPDHLLAVSTLLTERNRSPRTWVLGATWGLGHTLSLAVVAGTLAVLQMHLPAKFAAGFEAAVGGMLIVLGIRAVVRSLRERRSPAVEQHAHDGVFHVHDVAPIRGTLRPLLIGLVHGLAGSGAITALVLAELPDTRSRLVYIALFGLGSMCGMAGLTWAAGRPLHRLRRFATSTVTGLAGVCSGGFGVYWFGVAVTEVLRSPLTR